MSANIILELNSSKIIPLYSVHDHRTQKAVTGDLFISSIKTTQFGKRTTKYAGAILWNNVDTSIRSSLSLNVFNPIRPGFFSRSPGPGRSDARMPKIKVNISQLK